MSVPDGSNDSNAAHKVFDSDFLAMRSGVLDLAAALDRLDRAAAPQRASTVLADDPRWAKLRGAIEALLADGPGRAERVQLLFSLPFDEGWQEKFGLADPVGTAD